MINELYKMKEIVRRGKGIPHGRSDLTRTGDLYHPKVVR